MFSDYMVWVKVAQNVAEVWEGYMVSGWVMDSLYSENLSGREWAGFIVSEDDVATLYSE